MTNKTIIFVDDEPFVLQSYKRIFKGEDFHIELFSNPMEALDKVHEINPAVFITDQMMPGINGIELLEKVRIRYPSVIRILLTGITEKKHIIDAVNRGEIYRYLNKPWEPDDLLMTIKNAVEKFNLIAEFNKYKKDETTSDLKDFLQKSSEEITKSLGELKNLQNDVTEKAELLIKKIDKVSCRLSNGK